MYAYPKCLRKVQSAVLKNSLIVLPALPFKLIVTADQLLHQTVVESEFGEAIKPGKGEPFGKKVNDEHVINSLSLSSVTSSTSLGC